MTDPLHDAAGGALSELLEVSPQVDAAVILRRDEGRLLASAPASADQVAERLGTTCVSLLEAAEQARRELGREPVKQVEVSTPDGHLFVVSDARWIVAAVTDADPTVGIVFYDLKAALRAVLEAHAGANGAASPSAHPLVVPTGGGEDTTDEELRDLDAEGVDDADGMGGDR